VLFLSLKALDLPRGARALIRPAPSRRDLQRWSGRKIGTIGAIGCFSLQSHEMLSAGEGGVLITDDPERAARAVILSGACEHDWKKHPGLQNSFCHWQNRLTLDNPRMQNLCAAIIRPQLSEIARHIPRGCANHDLLAGLLNQSRWREMPPPFPPRRARRIRSSST
jgi:dTDP-4-amino-4,6-dideoxygalactose transaminase